MSLLGLLQIERPSVAVAERYFGRAPRFPLGLVSQSLDRHAFFRKGWEVLRERWRD